MAVPDEFSFVFSTVPPVCKAPVASLPPWLLAEPFGPPLAILKSEERWLLSVVNSNLSLDETFNQTMQSSSNRAFAVHARCSRHTLDAYCVQESGWNTSGDRTLQQNCSATRVFPRVLALSKWI